MYIYQRKKWPKFAWQQDELSPLLQAVRYKQGRLSGAMEQMGFKLRDETLVDTLTQDVVKSSEIEGEVLNPSLVRSSVARHLGVRVGALGMPDRNIDGIVEMILDATQHFDAPLTKKRLFTWHSLLFPTQRSRFIKIKIGKWRSGHVEVVSGSMGREKIHFEAPNATVINKEMKALFEWVEQDKKIDPLLKVAIGHLWFVTIHPFDDGNGRIGRAIADMLLARSENCSKRFYSLSSQIQIERKKYYAVLEETQKGDLEITAWMKWFLECLERAIDQALSTLDAIMIKAHFWERFSKVAFNDRQKKVLNRLLDGFKGKLTSSKWAKITKCSQDTAYRDIMDLVKRGVLVKSPAGGRSTSYSLAK